MSAPINIPTWINQPTAIKMLIEIEREHQGNEASSKTDQEILDEILKRKDENNMRGIGL